MRKYGILIFILILFTGCTPKYNLKISGNKLKENISFSIDKNKIVTNDRKPTYFDLTTGTYDSEYVNEFLNSDEQALVSDSSKFYTKKIEDKDHFIDVDLSYQYNMKNYGDSNVLTTCFDNPEIIEKDNSFYIHLTGRFSCLYDQDGQVDITIESMNKVIKHNADSKSLNKYKWTIDKNNSSNVDILFEVSKDHVIKYYGIRIMAIVLGGGILLIIFSKVGEFMNRDDINKI